jgi:hypothetical protein
VGALLLLLAAWAPWKFYRLLPLMEAGMAHHLIQPFRSNWGRFRNQSWRYGRQAATPPTGRRRGGPGTGGLPIAGSKPGTRRPAAGVGVAASGPAGAAAAAATLGMAAARGAAGRVASTPGAPAGGGLTSGAPRRPGSGGSRRTSRDMEGPAGWQARKVQGGGRIFIPTPGWRARPNG